MTSTEQVPTTPQARTLVLVVVACLLGLTVLLGLFAAVTPVIATGERGTDRCMRAYQERRGPVVLGVSSKGWSWRPYGVRCEVTRQDGRTDTIVVNPYW